MPRVATVELLPQDVKTALDERLRKSGFGDLLEHVEWLRQQGHETSKSALHRYSMAAKAMHRVGGKLAEALTNGESPSGGKEELVDLLLELGALRVREADILGRIEQLRTRTPMPSQAEAGQAAIAL